MKKNDPLLNKIKNEFDENVKSINQWIKYKIKDIEYLGATMRLKELERLSNKYRNYMRDKNRKGVK